MIAILFFLLHFFCDVQAQITFFCDGGHAGVNRSIQRGCTLNNITYNWNPDKTLVYPTVVVLAGKKYIEQAIAYKKEGKIKKLLVGPNVFVRSCEGGGIMADPMIDACLVPGEWVRIAYEQDNPALIGRIAVWPAGIDEYYWSPLNHDQKTKNVIIYWKTESEQFINQIKQCLVARGWNPLLVRYGFYNQQHYKELLQNAAFAVFISISESQGLALAEAWSMNVPTIVWDQQYLVAHGREYKIVSSCPYLSNQAGMRWKTLDEFENSIKNIDSLLPCYTPRAWVLEHMTDSESIRNLMNIVNLI